MSHHFVRVGQNLHSLLLGGIQPPIPPIRRDTGRLLINPLHDIFASLIPHKGNSASTPPNIGGVLEVRGGFAPPNIGGVSEGRGGFAPPNIGGVSEGRGGFAAHRSPYAYSIASLTFIPKLTY